MALRLFMALDSVSLRKKIEGTPGGTTSVSSAEAWPKCDASRTRQRASLRKKIEGTENTPAIYSTQQLGQGPTT
jgi:hypothetical protein